MKNEEREEKFNFVDDDSDFEENTKEENEEKDFAERENRLEEESNNRKEKFAEDNHEEKYEEEDDYSRRHNDYKENNHEERHHEEHKDEKRNAEHESNEEKYHHEEQSSYEEELPDTKTLHESINNSQPRIENNINTGLYLSFEARVAVMVVSAILFIGLAFALILDAVTYNDNLIVNYNENSNADYKVCLEENSDYTESCLGQNMQYLSLITKNIPITFNYDVKLSNAIKYDLDYYVVGSLKIVDRDNEEKVLYTKEDALVSNTKVSNESDKIQFTSNVDVDFKQYNNYVTSYKSRYSLNANAYLDVILYLNESTGPRRISSVTIPLGVQTYGISKNQTLNNNKTVVVNDNGWTKRNYIDAILGALIAIIGIVIVVRLIMIISKVTNSKSKYQRKLSQILREYDRVIVVARNGFEMNPNKKIIKVLSFNELLDARDTLEKPIVYVKINEVKSEFYVEDVDKVYQYVMKDADF